MSELVQLATRLWSGVGPVGRMTNPGLAAVIGFLVGGIGLAVYFRTIVDLLVPIAVIILLLIFVGDPGWLIGAFIASIYGYFRSAESNYRRSLAPGPDLAPGVSGV